MGASQSCAAQRDQFSPSPVRMTSLGDDQLTIGGERWSLGRLIGKGGFASVYEARRPWSASSVAAGAAASLPRRVAARRVEGPARGRGPGLARARRPQGRGARRHLARGLGARLCLRTTTRACLCSHYPFSQVLQELGDVWRLLHPVGWAGPPPQFPADAAHLVLIAQYEALGNRSLRERVRLALLVRDRVGNEQGGCEMHFLPVNRLAGLGDVQHGGPESAQADEGAPPRGHGRRVPAGGRRVRSRCPNASRRST